MCVSTVPKGMINLLSFQMAECMWKPPIYIIIMTMLRGCEKVEIFLPKNVMYKASGGPLDTWKSGDCDLEGPNFGSTADTGLR